MWCPLSGHLTAFIRFSSEGTGWLFSPPQFCCHLYLNTSRKIGASPILHQWGTETNSKMSWWRFDINVEVFIENFLPKMEERVWFQSIPFDLLPDVLFPVNSKVSYQRFPNLLGTAARIEGKGIRTIPPFFAGCDNYSHPNGLKWWNRSNLSETPDKKVRLQFW